MDYRKKIAKRVRQKLIIMIIISAAFAAVFAASELGRDMKLLHTIECAIVMLAVYLFILRRVKLVWLIRDKDWKGEIVKSEVRMVKGGKRFLVTSAAPRVPLLYLTVKKEDGKKYKAVYEVSRISLQYYAPGTKVIHLRGSEYLIRPDDKPGAYVCPLCANTLNKRYCPRCEVDFEKELPKPEYSLDYFFE